jgi:hypothetical protein
MRFINYFFLKKPDWRSLGKKPTLTTEASPKTFFLGQNFWSASEFNFSLHSATRVPVAANPQNRQISRAPPNFHAAF